MEHAKELIHMAANAIIFCIALMLLTHQVSCYNSILLALKTIYEDDVIYEQYNPRYQKNEITKSELIALLLTNSLEYDVKIDRVLIKKGVHNISEITEYGIESKQYRKHYCYDENGEIIRIEYDTKN